LPGNRIQILLRETTQVTPLGQSVARGLLPQQTIGVLVDAALPGAVWIGTIYLHPGDACQPWVCRQPLMCREYTTLTVRQREALLRLNAVEYIPCAGQRRLSRRVVQVSQSTPGEQRGPFHPRTDRWAMMRALDEVIRPVARNQPLFNLRRTAMNADPARNPPPPGIVTRTGAAPGMAETQPANHAPAQFATRQAA